MERKSLIALRNMERGKYFRIDADVIVDGESLGDMLVEASGDGPETGKGREWMEEHIKRISLLTWINRNRILTITPI